MCRIGGFLLAAASPPMPGLEAGRWAMIGKLQRRGPDDEGIGSDGRTGLAHARLAIIDLPSPISRWRARRGRSDQLRCEIYNFAEMRHALKERGYLSQRSRRLMPARHSHRQEAAPITPRPQTALLFGLGIKAVL